MNDNERSIEVMRMRWMARRFLNGGTVDGRLRLAKDLVARLRVAHREAIWCGHEARPKPRPTAWTGEPLVREEDGVWFVSLGGGS